VVEAAEVRARPGLPAVAFNASRNETLVYEVTYGGGVSAFNASTGALVWQRTVSPNVDSSPAVYGSARTGVLCTATPRIPIQGWEFILGDPERRLGSPW
jgi:outer membrane protein assembly factor BamB